MKTSTVSSKQLAIISRIGLCFFVLVCVALFTTGMNAFQLMKKIGYGGGSGTSYSEFVTTASSVNFYFTAPSGTTLHIDWGNGDSEDVSMTGSSVNKTKNYGSAGTRTIKLSGNGNTGLTSIVCYNNSLTSIDVSKNTALTLLSCRDNSLTSLNLSNNPALTFLNCYYNSITTLDLSNNTALTEVYCDNNSLTTLNVSGCSLLTDLECFNNSLIALDISSCTLLDNLKCQGNSLASLSIGNNTALLCLDCSNNALTSTIINSHLANLVSNGLSSGTYFSYSQSPSAPPTGQGVTDAATLTSRSWTVSTD